MIARIRPTWPVPPHFNTSSIILDMTAQEAKSRPWLTDEPSWKDLQNYYATMGSKLNMLEMFRADRDRFERYQYG
jgi:hypothetical protein